MPRSTTVRQLHVGQVFSVPGTDLTPALIISIAGPVGAVAFITVVDPADGTPLEARRVLNLDRAVEVHEVEAWHHHYRNISNEVKSVRLGRRSEVVQPGESIHFTGVAHPDVFRGTAWQHQYEPIVLDGGQS